jgi:predicted cation transporter
MLSEYGYKAFLAILLSTVLTALFFRKELQGNFSLSKETEKKMKPKWWIYAIHILFMALVVYTAHHLVFFMGVFLFFMGFTQVTQEYQDTLKLKESLMVGFFLAGLMVLGKDQAWWIGPFITSLGTMPLYIGATLLTAITDNAALTYLGSLGDLSEASKYFLLAGAVTGGGLTVIANAPNPAGFGILKDSFGEEGISPFGLLKAGLIPTIIAFLAFLILPHF